MYAKYGIIFCNSDYSKVLQKLDVTLPTYEIAIKSLFKGDLMFFYNDEIEKSEILYPLIYYIPGKNNIDQLLYFPIKCSKIDYKDDYIMSSNSWNSEDEAISNGRLKYPEKKYYVTSVKDIEHVDYTITTHSWNSEDEVQSNVTSYKDIEHLYYYKIHKFLPYTKITFLENKRTFTDHYEALKEFNGCVYEHEEIYIICEDINNYCILSNDQNIKRSKNFFSTYSDALNDIPNEKDDMENYYNIMKSRNGYEWFIFSEDIYYNPKSHKKIELKWFSEDNEYDHHSVLYY